MSAILRRPAPHVLLGLALVVVFAFGGLVAAHASPEWGRHHHGAPAPALAAGIPAFAALGGGAWARRWLLRRRAQRPE